MTTQSLITSANPGNDPSALMSAVKNGMRAGGEANKSGEQHTAVEFQLLFVEMMLKSMRETVSQDKLTGGGHGEEVYGSLSTGSMPRLFHGVEASAYLPSLEPELYRL